MYMYMHMHISCNHSILTRDNSFSWEGLTEINRIAFVLYYYTICVFHTDATLMF